MAVTVPADPTVAMDADDELQVPGVVTSANIVVGELLRHRLVFPVTGATAGIGFTVIVFTENPLQAPEE